MTLNPPALVIGLIIGAYWARVLKLVRKTYYTTGRSANFVPPEPLGRALRVVWYPVVVLWVAIPIYVGVHRPTHRWLAPPGRPPPGSKSFAMARCLIAIAAFIATLICWKKMGKSWRMGINPDDKTQLIITGPYSFVRHPIYALSSLLMICTVVILPSPIMLVCGVIHIAFLNWEASREELYLVRLHGEDYAGYARRTGRFFPRSLHAYSPGL